MRLKSEIWVKAYLRRCSGEAVQAVVSRRGQPDAGIIFIKIVTLDGAARLYGPAPAGLETAGLDRYFSPCLGGQAVPEADADAYLARQAGFDPDFWVIEVEDRAGRHFLDEGCLVT